ncbi:MAG: DciA family protein [Cycloclasticus sp.]|jgi:hypothetical protein|nr:DciA family protein [Cycloclasticus sp.]
MFKQPFKNKNLPLNGLQHIQQNLNQQRLLLLQVQSALPKDLATHCLHITASKKNVTLFTDSSVWASKLLYLRQLILKTLSDYSGAPVHTLKIKVLSKQRDINQSIPKSPSRTALKVLCEANNAELTDNLKISMNKLIKTLQKNKLSKL